MHDYVIMASIDQCGVLKMCTFNIIITLVVAFPSEIVLLFFCVFYTLGYIRLQRQIYMRDVIVVIWMCIVNDWEQINILRMTG